MKNMKFNTQKGFTLIEALVVIGVIALLVSQIYPLIQQTKESATAKTVNDDLRLLDQMIVQTRGPGGFNMVGLNLAEVVATDKSGKLRRDDGLGGFDLFVGEVFEVSALAPATSLTSNDSYQLTVDGFDDQQCSDIVRNVWPIYNAVSINGTSVKANQAQQIDAAASAAISTNCSELETNGVANSLAITKRING